MYSLDELVQYLENCHKSMCVDGPMEYMHGFGEGFRVAIETVASYKGKAQPATESE